MKTITKLGSIAAAFTLISTLALAAPKAERASKYFSVTGTVLEINQHDRTLLVSDRLTEKLYLIAVPEGVTIKIAFGRYMQMSAPGFDDVNIRERVEIRCKRAEKERLARLADGRQVSLLTATF
jgi:hypothetical protein